MPPPGDVTIVNVGYRSTNYWVIGAGRSRLLVDLGCPGTMGMMRAGLQRMGVPLREIRYGPGHGPVWTLDAAAMTNGARI